MAKYCNIVLWTDKMPEEIDPIMEILLPKRDNVYRLYQYHCTFEAS
jgi:hypothetical protein